MDRDVWDFIGIPRSANGEADEILTDIMVKIFGAFHHFLQMSYDDYDNLEEMIQEGINKKNEYSYFWNWFQEDGLSSLRSIANARFDNSDDTLDGLDERLSIMGMDISNGHVNSIFESIADTFEILKELISASQEQCPTLDDFLISNVTWTLPAINEFLDTQYVIQSPAGIQQGIFMCTCSLFRS